MVASMPLVQVWCHRSSTGGDWWSVCLGGLNVMMIVHMSKHPLSLTESLEIRQAFILTWQRCGGGICSQEKTA